MVQELEAQGWPVLTDLYISPVFDTSNQDMSPRLLCLDIIIATVDIERRKSWLNHDSSLLINLVYANQITNFTVNKIQNTRI